MQLQYKSTVDVRLVQKMGGDHMVVAAAKVSTSSQDALSFLDGTAKNAKGEPWGDEDTKGLINYLIKHRHGTPFEHSAMTFFVHAPIFVWREWHRHRIGFCLSGNSLLDFCVPSTNDRRVRTVRDFYRIWHHSPANKISAVRQMRLRCVDLRDNSLTSTAVKDVFKTGKKTVYSVIVDGGHEVLCSSDHRFHTPDGWKCPSMFSKNQEVFAAAFCGGDNTAERVEPTSSEEWRPFERNDAYEISSHGRVRSYFRQGSNKRHKHAILKRHTINNIGRPVVNLDGEILQVSRVVAETFLDVQPGVCVLHKDDDPTNNCLDNLYLGSDRENSRDRQRNGTAARRRIVPSRVLSIRKVGSEQTYDIEVEHPSHNFMADMVCVHNSYNEESGRYKQLEPIFYLPDRNRPMMKVDDWKPGRPKFLQCNDDHTYETLILNLQHSYATAYLAYTQNLSLGIDPGLARDCLPVGIYSGCWVTCNPRSLMAFLSLRVHDPESMFVSYPLWEIDLAAQACEQILKEGWPLTYAAFVANRRVAP